MTNKNPNSFCVFFYSLLLAAATVCLVSSAHGYFRFMQVVRAAKSVPPALSAPPVKKFAGFHNPGDMALRTVRFSVSAPEAQNVLLYADFNMWGAYRAELEKNSAGVFTKTVVLPQGEYKYYYLIDGARAADPQAASGLFYKGGEVSLKKVL
jgi:hypothetical protein